MNTVPHYIEAWIKEEQKEGRFREDVNKHLLTVLKHDLFNPLLSL